MNSAISIAALFISSRYFVNRPLNHEASAKLKIITGIMAGLTGSIMIFFGVQVTQSIIVDFRYISLIVASIYGGPIASIVGGLIIALFRIIYGGINYESIIASMFVLAAAIGCSLISKIRKGKKRKWIIMIFYCLVNSFFALYMVIPDYLELLKILLQYYVGFIILGFLVYYCAETITVSNSVIRNLKRESSKDFLTGLNNVRNFDILYNAALQNAYEKSESLSVIVIDIDYFKKINDTYGHQAGDAVLKQLGEILMEGRREFDIVSRNGGEEFSMILINCKCNMAFKIAERVRKGVEDHKFILPDQKKIHITISGGIATYPDSAKDNESLYKNADKALYKAKNSGRNRVCCYSEDSPIL